MAASKSTGFNKKDRLPLKGMAFTWKDGFY